MAVQKMLRSVSTTGLAAVMAASAPAAPMAQPAVRDGVPTPAACEALGFPAQGPGYGGPSPRIGAYRGSLAAPAPPPPPPPMAAGLPQIPPLPIPPVQKRLEQAEARMAMPPAPPRPAMDTERYPGAQANPIRRVAEEPVSTFSVDVDTASYANVRRFLNDGARPPADAVRVEEMINYFDYGYARPADRATPFRPYVAVTPSPWSKDRQIIHIGLQGYDLPRKTEPPLNLVFLVDTSGSMWSEDRLPLAIKSLNLLVDQLRPQDRVSIVAYAGSAGAVLAPTDGRNKLKVRCALGALRAGGSTAGGEGLKLAYDFARQNFDPKAVNRVILMTDGDFNVGVADPARLKDLVSAKRKEGTYLSVYGFGRGNYNDVMMQTLAQNGNGTAAYIDSLNEARKLLRDDFASSLFPIADDVKIQVEFNPASVSEYRLIGYETRMLQREDFNNDQVDAGEVGSRASVTALYEITPVGARASSDPLRYGAQPAPRTAGPVGELAYLKVRYKLPGGSASRLMERPIDGRDAYASVQAAPEPTRWALAVAAFGQMLKADPRIEAGYGWSDVAALAQGARGEDPFGLRAEFVQLVRAAGEAQPRAD
ncbi:VWA domain-containing protein [Phenylobacterium sp.]|uniref:vWA domain-containing protein n=1 Tax=Phenylobacterium sp. TaxID=1871053 RepID=UPI00289BFC98|nr:VWA domain-containing protein [Phenylobacterium sp.]